MCVIVYVTVIIEQLSVLIACKTLKASFSDLRQIKAKIFCDVGMTVTSFSLCGLCCALCAGMSAMSKQVNDPCVFCIWHIICRK